MANTKLQLQVITPTGIVYDKAAAFVRLRSIEGDIGILPGHENSAILLDYGDLHIFEENEQQETQVLAVLGGLATVNKSSVTVLSAFAGDPEKIDQAQREKMQAQREAMAKSSSSDTDIHLAELALRRSLVRGDVGVSTLLEDMHFDKD